MAISSSHSRRVQSRLQLLIHPSPELPSTRHQQMKDGAGDGPRNRSPTALTALATLVCLSFPKYKYT